jgi:hypothetical protein
MPMPARLKCKTITERYVDTTDYLSGIPGFVG